MNGAELSAFGRRLLERAESHQLTASADEVLRSPAQGLGSSDRLGAGQAHPAMAMEPVGVDDLGVVRGLAWALLEQSPNGCRQFRTGDCRTLLRPGQVRRGLMHEARQAIAPLG